jgi:hypothetical protein
MTQQHQLQLVLGADMAHFLVRRLQNHPFVQIITVLVLHLLIYLLGDHP